MNIPANLKYTKNHEWVKVDGDVAYIGVTDYAQSQLGDVVFIEIDTEGETIEQGETFGTVEAVKTVADLYMPIAGEVLEANPILEDAPESVNNSPYENGWLIKIKPANLADIDELMDADTYKGTIA